MIQRKVLKNGMTVVFKQRKNKVVCLAFAVRFGGGYESSEDKGIAHFIEHMLYKGTSKRSASQISTEIEKNGGELNGFTSEQITAFWCKLPSNHLNIGLDVLSDMVKNPVFDEKEIDKERLVIFEEMKMYKDNPRLYVFDKIKSKLYSGDFSIPIIGTKSSMKTNNQKKILDFFKKVYCPENMILTVVGDADFDEICNFAEKSFGKKLFSKISFPNISQNSGEDVEVRDSIDQANLVLAYHSPLFKDDKFYASHVLSILMAGGMSSRLFSEIREKRNLAYSIRSFVECEKDYSYSGIFVGTMKENVEIVKNLILEEFEKVSQELLENELNQVKEQIIGNYLLSHEDSFNILMDLLMSEIRGNAQESEKFIEKIKSVKCEDVKNLAKKIKEAYSFFALVPK
jgi:predicted Zn-dependent peptidase